MKSTHWNLYAIVALLALMLSACGFQLRGIQTVAFQSIHIQGNTLLISKNLKKSLEQVGVKVLPSAEGADLLLELMSEENEKRILSLSGGGTVREFELYYRVHYRTRNPNDATWAPPQTIEARRDFSYDDANLLAKQAEEKQLNENMQRDVLNNLMRRLSALKSRQ